MVALQRTSGRSPACKRAGRTLLTLSRVVVVAALLVVSPLLWGGRHPLAQGVMGVTASVALLLWAVGVLSRGRWACEPARGLWLLLPVLAVLVLQLVPSVFSWWPAPALADLWTKASEVADVGPARFAVMPENQWAGIYAVVTAAIVYWLTMQLFNRRLRVLWLVVALALAGIVTAVAGLCQAFGGWEWFLWLYKGAEKTASAGYFNRDHFAQLCALTVFVSLGLSVGILTAPRGSRMAEWAAGRRWLGWVFAAGAVAALLAVIFSYSRAAVLTVIAGFFFFTTGLWLWRGKRTVSLSIAVVGVTLFIASFYGLGVLSERIAFVLSGTDPSALVRQEIWATVLDVIAMSPWLGSGWDGVAALASTLDTSYIPGFFVNAAHSDYLELMVIVGVPLAGLVLVGGLWLYGKTLWRVAVLGRRSSSFFPLVLGLLVGITVVLAQETVEYGLKQPANLLLFVTACGALGLVLKTAESEKSQEMRQPVLGMGVFKGPILNVAVAAIVGTASVIICYEGWLQVQMETVTQAGLTNVALPERLVLESQLEAAQAVLAVNPQNVPALTEVTEVRQAQAQAARRESLARALTVVLERPVSERQAERLVYAPYRAQAVALIPEEERRMLAKRFGAVEETALVWAQASPSNAAAVVTAASAQDEQRSWANELGTAVAWYRYASALAPSSVSVLERVVQGFARAYVTEVDEAAKDSDAQDFVRLAGNLIAEAPSDLTWILPLTETLGIPVDTVMSLVPKQILGQEFFARWLLKKGQYETALSALDHAEVLNCARLEDEKPWTMGRVAYLAREKREKVDVAQSVDRLRLAAYEGLGNEMAVEVVSARIKARQAELNGTVIARVDALMVDGDWVLADELLKPLKTDPRALVRRAEMALTMNRMEGAGQRMKEFEDVAKSADEETRVRAEKVLERLDRLKTVRAPESH